MVNKILDASLILLIQDGLILSVSRGKDHTLFGLPGGMMEKEDANVKETAIREMMEETGLVVAECEWLYSAIQPRRIGRDYDIRCHCFLAPKWTGEVKESDEGIVRFISMRELTETHAAYPEFNSKVMLAHQYLYPDVILKNIDTL